MKENIVNDEKRPVVRVSLSLPALERLIGGDAELEVNLRHQIVENFSKAHLQDVVKSEAFKRVLQDLYSVTEQEIRKEIGQVVNRQWNPSSQIAQRIKSVLEHEANRLVSELVTQKINEQIKYCIQGMEARWAKHIEERVSSTLNSEIDRLVKEEIDRRLKAALEMQYPLITTSSPEKEA